MLENSSGDVSDAKKPDDFCRHYNDMIDRYEREFKPWHERATKIMDIYTEQRKSALANTRRMPLLWANVNVLQPAVYNRLPLPVVSRRFKDADPVARVASEMIERCLHYTFDMGDADRVARSVRDDQLLVGRGTSWVRYEADFKPQEGAEAPAEVTPEGEPAEVPEVVADERIAWDYVHWDDFGHNVARHWAEVTTVWKRVYMTRKKLKARFGNVLSAEEIQSIPLNFKPKENAAQQPANTQAIVYEIWCKEARKVIFLVRGFHKLLEVMDPPLTLHNFFPCPPPAYTTCESASLIPVPDYVYFQGQAEEIDELTAKISSLTDALKMVGFYPADMEGDGGSAIEKAADPRVQNKMIAVKNWAAFTAGSGGGPTIVWWPAGEVAKTIKELISVRQQLIDDVYQITGISDILRGDGQASETATAQNIKSQWGSMRIRDRQINLGAHIRDMARIGGEIIAEMFHPETLLRMSNLKLPTRMEVEQAKLRAQAEAQAQAQAQAMQQAQQGPPQGAPVPGGPM